MNLATAYTPLSSITVATVMGLVYLSGVAVRNWAMTCATRQPARPLAPLRCLEAARALKEGYPAHTVLSGHSGLPLENQCRTRR